MRLDSVVEYSRHHKFVRWFDCVIDVPLVKKPSTERVNNGFLVHKVVRHAVVAISEVVSVRVTYNEDSIVIMTVTGSASQLRGSELLKIGSYFLGTDKWV